MRVTRWHADPTMIGTSIAGGVRVTALALLASGLVGCDAVAPPAVEPVAATRPADRSPVPTVSEQAAQASPDFIYGRITTVDGATYEGRLRWGQDQEASWSDFFNGTKDENPWVVHAPAAERPQEHTRYEIFGIRLGGFDGSSKFDRQFMARFGDIARIEAHVGDVQVTLKSGSTFRLNRFEAGDIDDGVRVWDGRRGVVDLDARRISTIEFLPAASSGAAADRLHGTVRARQGVFTGFIQWDRQDGVRTDELNGRSADGELRVRYDTIHSIARQSRDSARVTLLDGRELVLAGTRDTGAGNLGIYVDDRRFGRVLISWDAFDRVEFSPGVGSVAYSDFPPGRALAGSVTTRDGRRFAGRLVYDFDESETTDTLDAPLLGVEYNIPFSSIASILPAGRDGSGAARAAVFLQNGEELALERTGDLGERNAGMLIFVSDHEHPDYVPWSDVARIDFDRKAARDSPAAGR